MVSLPSKKGANPRVKTEVLKPAPSKKAETQAKSTKLKVKKPAVKKKESVKTGEIKKVKKTPLSKKVIVVEAKNKKVPKLLIANNTFKKLGPSKMVAKPNVISVAKPSPYRFPAIRQVSLTTFARYVGIFFVSFGGLFSLINLQYISTDFAVLEQHQLAQTSTALYDTSSNFLQTESTTNLTTDTAEQVMVNEKPDAQILIENQGSLSGDVSVAVIVPYADSVQLIVRHRDNGYSKSLDFAKRIDDRAWKVMWNTNEFPNGEYELTAVIKNAYGSYTKRSATRYLVANQTLSTVNTSPSSDVTSSDPGGSLSSADTNIATTTDVTTSTQQEIVLTISEKSPLAGGVFFEVSGVPSGEVAIYTQNENTRARYFVGLAQQKEEGVWVFDWSSKRVPDGKYIFVAKVTYNNTVTESASVVRYVKNELITSTATTSNEIDSSTISDLDVVAPSNTELAPVVQISLSKPDPLFGFVEIGIQSTSGEYVELYVKPKDALTPRFVGSAHPDLRGNWKYLWDTRQTPNGEFELFARVKNIYGYTDSTAKRVKVLNEVSSTLTGEQEKTIDAYVAINNQLYEEASDAEVFDDEGDAVPTVIPTRVYIEPINSFAESLESEIDEDEDISVVEQMLEEYRSSLDDILHDYARAVRNDDTDEMERIIQDIENLKSILLVSIPATIEKKDLVDKINAYISKITFELKDLTEKNEKIIKDRIGDAIHADSDNDGISDYDEVNLYQTDPYNADTDGDGYIDSAEITLGYDPHDSRSEAYIAYESAKEVGIVREDMFSVDSITTIVEDAEEVSEPKNKALLSGKALPNSHVTIYIYSTPIVVTIKTDNEGNWSYLFDKELEDGEHEVYVGITDNTGKIIAKSNPFAFVKTAQAFEGVEPAAAAAFEGATPSLVNTNMMVLISSLAVVALGLVLIILGLYASERKRSESLVQTI